MMKKVLLVAVSSLFLSIAQQSLAAPPDSQQPIAPIKRAIPADKILGNTTPVQAEQITLTPVPAGTVTALAAGAWSGSGVGPNLFNAGIWFSVGLTPPGPVPNVSSTTLVTWNWSVLNYRSDLQVVLCNFARCGDISAFQSGSTSFFNGDSANTEYRLYFQVPGNGEALSPAIFGQTDTVNVSYTF